MTVKPRIESIDPPLVEEYLEITKGLWPIIPDDVAYKNIHRILPKLHGFLHKLADGNSGLIHEIGYAMREAVKYAYERRDWKAYLSLQIIGFNEPKAEGEYGLLYTDTYGDSFKDSIMWILTGALPGSRSLSTSQLYRSMLDPEYPRSIGADIIEPAKLYHRWKDVGEDNPTKIFNNLNEVIDFEGFSGQSFFVSPSVLFYGLPIADNKAINRSLCIQNWFGDNTKVIVSRLPRNPYWDT